MSAPLDHVPVYPDPSASPRLYLLSIIAAGMSLAVVGMVVWWMA